MIVKLLGCYGGSYRWTAGRRADSRWKGARRQRVRSEKAIVQSLSSGKWYPDNSLILLLYLIPFASVTGYNYPARWWDESKVHQPLARVMRVCWNRSAATPILSISGSPYNLFTEYAWVCHRDPFFASPLLKSIDLKNVVPRTTSVVWLGNFMYWSMQSLNIDVVLQILKLYMIWLFYWDFSLKLYSLLQRKMDDRMYTKLDQQSLLRCINHTFVVGYWKGLFFSTIISWITVFYSITWWYDLYSLFKCIV